MVDTVSSPATSTNDQWSMSRTNADFDQQDKTRTTNQVKSRFPRGKQRKFSVRYSTIRYFHLLSQQDPLLLQIKQRITELCSSNLFRNLRFLHQRRVRMKRAFHQRSI